jgi:hypothetical protein
MGEPENPWIDQAERIWFLREFPVLKRICECKWVPPARSVDVARLRPVYSRK